MIYKVVKQTITENDRCWDSSPWNSIIPAPIKNHMGEKPAHFPEVEVKLAYDDISIYLFFKVKDRYVRAIATKDQGNVWEDSCVEFFFTPGDDASQGYFNIEMNCIGTMLFNFQQARDKGRIVIPQSECDKIKRDHSLKTVIDPEITEPVKWTVQYSIPILLLTKYCQLVTPETGVKWRANFYKCGDNTSHPHWLTWSSVNYPKPNFHRPESFGTLEFE